MRGKLLFNPIVLLVISAKTRLLVQLTLFKNIRLVFESSMFWTCAWSLANSIAVVSCSTLPGHLLPNVTTVLMGASASSVSSLQCCKYAFSLQCI